MNALTAAHYRAQLALKAQTVRDAHALWQMFDPQDRDSWSRMLKLATLAVHARHKMSAGIAAAYYSGLALERARVDEAARLAPALDDTRIEKSLTATGLVGTVRALSVGKSTEAAMAVGFVRFSGSLSRLAMTGGRDTILESVQASRRAVGYSRITSGNACSFCSGLAGEASAPDAFAAHDHCSCTAEPTFG